MYERLYAGKIWLYVTAKVKAQVKRSGFAYESQIQIAVKFVSQNNTGCARTNKCRVRIFKIPEPKKHLSQEDLITTLIQGDSNAIWLSHQIEMGKGWEFDDSDAKRGFNALYASLTETPKLFAAIYDRYVYDIADEELNF